VFAEAATLQALLEGVSLPASKQELIAYAREQDGGSRAVALLERLPEREYTRLDEVGEELVPVQPSSNEAAKLPRAESGLPPGGDDYVRPHPSSGEVRDDAPPANPPQKAIEQQTKTQKAQKERQEKRLGD
jgi:hypothetical protein